jgi:putative cell wall-binding protein
MTNYNKNLNLLYLIIIGILIIVLAVLIYLNKSKTDNIIIQAKEISEKDSLINNYKLLEQKERILSETAKSYLQTRSAHNPEALNDYYADTLDNYYKYLSKCTKDEVMKSEIKYWSNFKVDSFIVKSEPEIIIDSTLIQATFKGLQCPYPNDCTEEIMVLKFNPSFKIVSVKAYYLK